MRYSHTIRMLNSPFTQSYLIFLLREFYIFPTEKINLFRHEEKPLKADSGSFYPIKTEYERNFMQNVYNIMAFV